MFDTPPDYAIFQNSRTKQSALWVKTVGKWRVCSKSDYEAIQIMANMLRNSKDAGKLLQQIAQAIIEMSDEE